MGLFVRRTATLWLASDHLLLLFSTRFNEEFKRFYLRDIQAITIRKTNNAFIWSGVWLTVALFFALLSLAVQEPTALWTLRSIAGFFLLCAIVCFAPGASCIAEIKTAVHTEELSSLKRLRKARKVLALLRPLIEQAQGKITAEQIVSATGAGSPMGVPNPPSAATARPEQLSSTPPPL